jgi:thiol-disulfide isomerase/thioredoxin
LTDLHGKTWQLADLKGKVVFLNFWASWCHYCREELPRLQKLAEEYKNQSDMLFLSLNMDDDPGLVDPFAKQFALTFPILPAYDYVTNTLRINSIPRNWIVNRQGIVRLKGNGYDATEKWDQGMRDAIENCKSPAAGPAVPVSAGPTRPPA